ncbi:MAG TPA: NAD-dependent succinate-semialdehyde dehydrogenase [Candidatus Polarisedimenticolia bacterium]|jgi:succinate-semialdehyde dehydrogenase/glutarate-semialdehyde dehydrogenase|nr:NAD-dependent succinate-semialdehyde dehydrogenase [Candidatus Polarisedimenticolia bacterium]
MGFVSVDPTTGQVLKNYKLMPADTVAGILAQSQAAFLKWRDTGFEDRAACLRRVADSLRQRATEHAEIMAREMGKPLREGRAEIEKCALGCEYYAEHAPRMLQPEPAATAASRSYVTFEPLGVLLAIMPWNFPFWQIFRFGAPALMAGNAILLKHAPSVPDCAFAIERLFRETRVPEGLVRPLLVDTDTAGELIGHPVVQGVTLTGSPAAGRAVARKAGESLKKCVLELGGSDPYILLDDADLDDAVGKCIASRLVNGGQSCIAAKRFIVPKSLRGRFEERFVAGMAAKKMGNPLDETSDLGPLARLDLRDNLHRQVRLSIEAGARCLLGGTLPNMAGAFYPPTVLTDVARGMPAYEEELFGPVAAILPVEDEAAAIEAANDSPYGLGAAIFSSDPGRAEKLAARLRCGSCFINDFVRSDPALPFGGIKQSGFGRELGAYGIKEFVNVKSVWVK